MSGDHPVSLRAARSAPVAACAHICVSGQVRGDVGQTRGGGGGSESNHRGVPRFTGGHERRRCPGAAAVRRLVQRCFLPPCLRVDGRAVLEEDTNHRVAAVAGGLRARRSRRGGGLSVSVAGGAAVYL